MIKIEKERINNSKYYSVGYSPALEMYILVTIITDESSIWFNRYFSITEKEYHLFDFNIQELDAIAEMCFKCKTSSRRFLCSELRKDNKKIPYAQENFDLMNLYN